MTDKTNRGETVSPSVVPASFTPPAPEQFEKPVTQNLRTKQSQLGQGFALYQISFYENQLHTAQYKRVNTDLTDAELAVLVKDSKTARTVMMNNIPAWAGNLGEEELDGALPTIWNYYMQAVQEENSPAPEPVVEAKVETPGGLEEADETPDPREMEPIQVISRPDVPAEAPKSKLEAPKEPTLGEVLGKISEDNSD